jgi:hypothetical protein
MAKQIIVLSDGETWEINGYASILTITDEAYDLLCGGQIKVKNIENKDILGETPIEDGDKDERV